MDNHCGGAWPNNYGKFVLQSCDKAVTKSTKLVLAKEVRRLMDNPTLRAWSKDTVSEAGEEVALNDKEDIIKEAKAWWIFRSGD